MLTIPTCAFLTQDEKKQLNHQRFKAIYKATLDILNLSPEQVPHSKGYRKCWLDILKIWNENVKLLGSDNIVYFALFHLCTQKFPSRLIDKRVKNLVQMVEQELIDDGYAFKTWNEYGILDNIFDFLLIHGYKNFGGGSELFFYQSHYRAYREVLSKGKQCLLGHRKEHHLGELVHFDECITNSFEQVITLLLPDASSWTSQWHDFDHICKCLNKEYCIDYSADCQSFDRMIEGITAECLGEYTSPKLLAVDNFSMAMANAVWGDIAEKRITAYFEYAYTQASHKNNHYNSKGFTFRSILNSWIYCEMLKLEKQKNPLITADIRKHLFNVPIWA